MKKSLIAGAGVAAFAFAALPFAGVFATDTTTMTDVLTITVEDTCTFDAASHAYRAAMEANALNENVGTTTMNVVCNNYTGYTVTGAFADLNGNGSNKITFASTAPTAGSGTWAAYSTPTVGGSAGTAAYLTNNGEVLKNTQQTPAGGDSASIVYKVSTTNNQAAGTYTNANAAVYTLAKNPAS